MRGNTGAGTGDWRLGLSSELDIEVLAYLRTKDGFLTAMHDVVPTAGTHHRIAIANPGSNVNQISRLRLVNSGSEDAEVTITGIDDHGESPGDAVTVSIPTGAARTYTAIVPSPNYIDIILAPDVEPDAYLSACFDCGTSSTFRAPCRPQPPRVLSR